MVRFLLWMLAAYVVYRILRRIIIEVRRYFPEKPPVRTSTSPHSTHDSIDYTKVQDADFKDVKEKKDDPS